MSDVTVFHHAQCSTSRHALTVAEDVGVDVEVVQYLKTPLTRDQLLALIAALEDSPAGLVRKDSFFKDQGLDAADHTTPEQVADLLVELGARAAINLDGGSSSALVTAGVRRNRPRDDTGMLLSDGYLTTTAFVVRPRRSNRTSSDG